MLLSVEERLEAVRLLEASRNALLALLEQIPAAEWHHRPPGGGWTVAEITEHLCIVEGGVLKRLTHAPPPAEDHSSRDEQILRILRNRVRKVEAPEPVRPVGRLRDPEALKAKFLEVRGRSIAWALDLTATPRAHALPHPFMGELDGYQWLLMFVAHSERHTEQIRENQPVRVEPAPPA